MIKKITNNIFYMPHFDDTDRPALGLVCGQKYSLVVDAGNSPGHAKEFLANIKAMDIPTVKYLALTHHHWDHTFGIAEMGLVTIAHEETKKETDKMKELKWDDASLDKYVREGIITEFTSECIKTEISERDNFTIGDVDITYTDSIKIDLGGLTCVLEFVGGPHTDDSTIVFIPEEKVMFIGDCVYGRRYNGLYAYDKKKLSMMIDIIGKYSADYYVCSHMPLFYKEEISKLWEQLGAAEQAAGEITSLQEANRSFYDRFNREPSSDEAFYINCFINYNKANY